MMFTNLAFLGLFFENSVLPGGEKPESKLPDNAKGPVKGPSIMSLQENL